MLGSRLSKPNSAPFSTAVLPWRRHKENEAHLTLWKPVKQGITLKESLRRCINVQLFINVIIGDAHFSSKYADTAWLSITELLGCDGLTGIICTPNKSLC